MSSFCLYLWLSLLLPPSSVVVMVRHGTGVGTHESRYFLAIDHAWRWVALGWTRHAWLALASDWVISDRQSLDLGAISALMVCVDCLLRAFV